MIFGGFFFIVTKKLDTGGCYLMITSQDNILEEPLTNNIARII